MDVYLIKVVGETTTYQMRDCSSRSILALVFQEPGKTEQDIYEALNRIASMSGYKIQFLQEQV